MALFESASQRTNQFTHPEAGAMKPIAVIFAMLLMSSVARCVRPPAPLEA